MLLDFVKQKPYNAYIQSRASKYGLKTILTQDCHYCEKEHSKYQRLMLMIQTGKTVSQLEAAKLVAESQGEMADLFELQDSNLWMKSEEELNEKWEKDYSDVIEYEFLAEAKRETVRICEMAKGIILDRSMKLPKLPDADLKLKESIMEGFKKRGLPMNKEYLDRIKEEYSLICQKEFSSYFLIQKMMTDEARRYWGEMTGTSGDEAVGPGRGSAAGSLVCYCLRITDINPIPHDLLFSRFLSPARGGKSMKLRFSIDPVAV
jgi:DNA polymerase-3 subunit alpha